MEILGQGTQGGWLLNSPLFGSAAKAIKRYITELSAAGNQYDAFTSDVVLDGDFEIEVDHLTTETGVKGILGQADNNFNIIYTEGDALKMRLDSGTYESFGVSPVALSDGKLHRTVITRVGSTISATTDGQAHSRQPSDSGTLTLDSFGRFSSVYWQGILANLKITKTGTLIVDAKKDGDGTSNLIVNDAAVLGSEQVTDNTSGTWLNSRAGAISDISGGIRATANSTSAQGAAYPLTGLNVGEDYLVSFTTDSDDATGSMFPRVALDQALSTNTQEIIPSYNVEGTTAVEGTFTAIASTMYVGVVRTTPGIGTYVEVTNATIKEIPSATPYLTRINQTTDEVTLYTEDAGNYIGPELWELPIYTFAGTEVSGDIIQSENILQAEAAYRVTFSGSGANVGITTGAGGSTRALIGNSSVYADGNPFDVTDTVTAQSPTARWQVLGTPPFSGSCSIDSVKRYLEVA